MPTPALRLGLVVLVLATACSSSSHPKAAPSPSASQSASPQVTSGPATSTPTATSSAAREVGPEGFPVPAGFVPVSATFVSDRSGWVLGAGDGCPTGRGDCEALARTRDGGRTWDALVGPPLGVEDLAKVRFANLRDGYVTGTHLWATHDGGGTWRQLPGLDNANEVEAAAGRVWVLVSGHLSSGPVAGGALVAEHAPADTTSFLLHGADVVVTRNGSSALYVGGHGRAFVARPTPCDAQADTSVGLASATRWLLVCGDSAGAGHQEKKAYLSTDAGQHWSPAGAPPPLVGTTVSPTTDGDFVIDHQEVAVSRDRDATWQVCLSSDGGIEEAGFESATLGFAIGAFGGSSASVMELTRDAGRSWTKVTF